MSIKKNTIFVIGHRNPDTDSIVAATAYAAFQNLLGHPEYVAARAGHLTPQTEYIYKKFGVPKPQYFHDMIPRAEFYMQEDIETVNEKESLWKAVSIMEKNQGAILPVVDDEGNYHCFLHYNSFAKNLLNSMNPTKKIGISTTINLIYQTLRAQLLYIEKGDQLFTGTIVCAVDDFESFKHHLDELANRDVILITGARNDVFEYALQKNVKAIIFSSGRLPKKEWTAEASKKGISVLSSPYDTSSTAMLITYSTPVSIMADRSIKPVSPNDTLRTVRPLLSESPSRALPVVDENNKVVGIISETDLSHDAKFQLALVDHNEKSQAVEGFEHYTLNAIIDHHRIGNLPTRRPITFLNMPVGSTSSIVTNLFFQRQLAIPVEIAQILLCGILSDTLILQSATTTDFDRELAEKLSDITGLDIQTLGREILHAGSRITDRSAKQIVQQDMKEYNEGKVKFTVSQIEVDHTAEILDRKAEFFGELDEQRKSHGSLFAALLVTDITRLSSQLFVSAEKSFLPVLNFPKTEDGLYFLKDVVSRKKQLIPMLTELIEKLDI